MFCSLQQAVHYLALLASQNCLFSCLLRPEDVLDKERTGGISSLPSLLCWVDIEHSFSHKTSTVLQHHRSFRTTDYTETPETFPIYSAARGPGGPAQPGPCALRSEARPGPAPPARRGRSTHTPRGASGQRPRLGMDMLGQGQRRGTARTPGALTGCHRPPHLASLSASGVPNARTDRRSYGRGSRSPPLWGQALSLGDSNAQMPAGFALRSPLSSPGSPGSCAGSGRAAAAWALADAHCACGPSPQPPGSQRRRAPTVLTSRARARSGSRRRQGRRAPALHRRQTARPAALPRLRGGVTPAAPAPPSPGRCSGPGAAEPGGARAAPSGMRRDTRGRRPCPMGLSQVFPVLLQSCLQTTKGGVPKHNHSCLLFCSLFEVFNNFFLYTRLLVSANPSQYKSDKFIIYVPAIFSRPFPPQNQPNQRETCPLITHFGYFGFWVLSSLPILHLPRQLFSYNWCEKSNWNTAAWVYTTWE